MWKAIFWDNDGVLVDTEHLYYLATKEALARRGVDFDAAQYLQLFLQQSKGIFHFAERHGWSADEVEVLRRERSGLYSDLLRERADVIDGVRDVLATLHGRYKMGIVTSSQREHFDIAHAASGLLPYFDFVLASGDYSHTKPHPAPYLTAIERSGLPKEQCVVIEDSERGLVSATAAGLPCIVVPSRLTEGRPFHGAYKVLGNIRELLDIL